MYRLPIAVARPFDPYGTISKALWQMRRFSLPQNKPLEVEDVIRDILNENICKDRRDKWQDLAKLEQAMKLHDPSFKEFCVEMNYWEKFDKCIENFYSLIASVPNEVKNMGAPQ